MVKKIIIALGGNALQSKSSNGSAEDQLAVVKETVRHIADIVERGIEIAVVHGNGPQVGRLLLQQEAAKDIVPPLPFDVCGAMSQGYIGYHIQSALKAEIARRGRDIPVVSIITQIVVDKEDPAFKNPTKPIGPFYSEEEARKLEREKGYVMKEDAGRGFRRVVSSPVPVSIAEAFAIKKLWDTTIVIASGGGGVPAVREEDGNLTGVDAVIDKDLAAEMMANEVSADALLILTEVEHAYVNFGKPDQRKLGEITVSEARRYMDEGHFAAGSMGPKMLAAIKFAEKNKGKRAIITSLDSAVPALDGKTGTHIVG
jgi:carbamate kinase